MLLALTLFICTKSAEEPGMADQDQRNAQPAVGERQIFPRLSYAATWVVAGVGLDSRQAIPAKRNEARWPVHSGSTTTAILSSAAGLD